MVEGDTFSSFPPQPPVVSVASTKRNSISARQVQYDDSQELPDSTGVATRRSLIAPRGEMLPGGGRKFGTPSNSKPCTPSSSNFANPEEPETVRDTFASSTFGFQDSRIKVAHEETPPVDWIVRGSLLALLLWNLILTYMLIAQSFSPFEFAPGGNKVIFTGKELQINSILRVGGNVLVQSDSIGQGNLVVGKDHEYAEARNSFIAGEKNAVSSNAATVAGGFRNSVEQEFASILGGTYNIAKAKFSTVAGGEKGTVSGEFASIGGGCFQTAATRGGFVYPPVGGGPDFCSSETDADIV